MTRVRDLALDDTDALATLYEDYEWWAGRDAADVREALAETDVAVGAFDAGDVVGVVDSDDVVGAARVLTDFTYYANVYDVVVATDRRGEGIGETLLRAVVDHPDLQDVDGLSLLCRRGLVPFYESAGFDLFDPEIDVPDGGTEELVRMTYERDG